MAPTRCSCSHRFARNAPRRHPRPSRAAPAQPTLPWKAVQRVGRARCVKPTSSARPAAAPRVTSLRAPANPAFTFRREEHDPSPRPPRAKAQRAQHPRSHPTAATRALPVTVVQFKDRRDLVAVAALGHPRGDRARDDLRRPAHAPAPLTASTRTAVRSPRSPTWARIAVERCEAHGRRGGPLPHRGRDHVAWWRRLAVSARGRRIAR
jgi:hypothetical protein